jgi:serine/threonine-protein kinase
MMNNQPDAQQIVASSPLLQSPDCGPEPPVSASVLQALEAMLPELPCVQLRDPDISSTAATIPFGPTKKPEQRESAGRYHLLGEIARGGMGAVFKGRDADLGREIAVKVLLETHQGKAELVGRFVEEAQIGGQLQHPGIVPVYELGTFPDQRPYFTMKLVKGQTLAKLLTARSDPAQDRPRFLKIFEQVCQTLAYAHSRGVVHRDLKPANVMVGAFGEVQVMDWGLAKVLREGGPAGAERPGQSAEVSVIRTRRGEDSNHTPEGTQTQSGSVLGTPAYMPQEQALGEVDRLDERADVFGLGAILCEILTGQPPYVGADSTQTHRKAVRADLVDAMVRLDGCGADPELVALARRCLAAEPEGRPRDAGVLAGELTAYLESVETRLRQAELQGAEARARAAEERKRRKLAVALVGAVLGLVVLGGGGWFYVAGEREARERETLTRQAEVARQVQEALGRADNLRQQARADNDPAKWAEARALAEYSRSLLADLPEGHALAQRVEVLTNDLAGEEQDRLLLERLEEVGLLRAGMDAQVPGFALRRALIEYPRVFAEHGLRPGDGAETGFGWVLHRPPPTRERLIAGLDAWLGLARQLKAPETHWLFELLQAADGDAWRKGLRAAVVRDDAKEVERLTRSDALRRQRPQTLLLLADYFRPRSIDRALELLRAAQARFPADFWINFTLADTLYQKHFQALSEPAEFEDAVRFYTTALALRPDNLHMQTLLAWSLWLRGRRAEGRVVVQQVIDRRPDYFGGHLYLGMMSMLEDKGDEAEAAYRQALRLQPGSGMAHSGMGFVLWARGQYDEALRSLRLGNRLEPFPRGFLGQAGVLGYRGRFEESAAVYRQALQFQPDFVEAQFTLRLVILMEAGRADEAVALCRGLILLRPNVPELHALLNRCLIIQGRLADALPAARRALELSPKTPSLPVGVLSLIVRETEQLLALEPLLPSYVKGERKPRDAQELTVLITLCVSKREYLGAARLYTHAFAADPRLAEDVTAEQRYDAARFAARAAAGQGDAAGLDEKERARWRKQTLDWLQAELAGWHKLLEGGSDDDRVLAQERLRWWQEDPKLAGLRDPEALAKLTAEEQKACRELWAGVAESLAKIQK